MTDYEKDLNINMNDLKNEWQKQAPLYMFYAQESAKLEKAKDSIKEKLDVKKAELDINIREIPSNFTTVPKLTESVVNSLITKHPDIQELQSLLNQAKFDLNILNSAVKAFEHKKKALENLVILDFNSQYSEPTNKKEKTLLKGRRNSRKA